MKITKLVCPLALFAAFALNFSVRAAEAADSLPSIFNGKDFTGWNVPERNLFWKAADGVIVGQNDEAKKGSLLWTEQSYGDFVIECEARWSGEIDSGILLRKPELQLQLGVSRSLKRDWTGSFYTGGPEKYPEAGQAKNLEKYFKPGDWNHYRLEAKGDTFTVWLNGVLVVKYTNAKYAGAGPIGLQIHQGLAMQIQFRNLRAKARD